MTSTPSNWHTITPSDYPWEQEGLDFVRAFLPEHDPYRAWANFEFIAEDHSINEVDLLLTTPKGLFLVELKAWSGEIDGDSGQWLWTTAEGRRRTVDNPLLLANRKAKKLASLLKRQARPHERQRIPYVTPLIFLSAEAIRLRLLGRARHGICTRQNLRDVLCHLENAQAERTLDRPQAKAVTRALDAAGIREANRTRKILEYELQSALFEGDHFQDWLGRHADNRNERRIRVFQVHGKPEEEASLLRQAARRESQVLEHLDHPGILRVQNYVDHELGPALVYEYASDWQRLDQYLLQRSAALPADAALDLVRAIANTLRYAHDRKLYHRSLSPQCIFLTHDPLGSNGRGNPSETEFTDTHSVTFGLKIGNWHAAERVFQRQTRQLTRFAGEGSMLAEDAGAYTALEAWSADVAGTDAQAVDVFSLGALAYLLFTGEAPAANDIELQQRLQRGGGLQVSDVMAGASAELQDLVLSATHPDATHRLDAVADFLVYLDAVENELTRPDNLRTQDPINARVGEQFDGGLLVKGRLGQGASAVAFLVQHDDKLQVLKLASTPEQNARLRAEGDTLARLRHPNIVAHHETLELLGHAGVLIDHAEGKTLAAKLRAEGGFGRELLERHGAELLSALCHLEEFGVAHRDIKPENIGLTKRSHRAHLLLFDFSLSQEPAENYRSGTAAYLDPYLREPGRQRWDLHAERFAAALTLYEMAAGVLPAWAQQEQLPPYGLDNQLELDATVFDASVRESLAAFFCRALARQTADRFDHTEAMLNAWQRVFTEAASANQPAGSTSTASRVALPQATPETAIGLLAVDDAMLDTLARLGVNTVAQFLARPKNEYQFLSGVGTNTRRAIADAYDALRQRLHQQLGAPSASTLTEGGVDDTGDGDGIHSAVPGVEALLRNVAPTHRHTSSAEDHQRSAFLCAMLGHELAEEQRQPGVIHWPNFQQVCRDASLDADAAGELYRKRIALWGRNPHVTQLRNDVQHLLEQHGGVMTARELAQALLLRRGSTAVSPWREWHAEALVRVAVETELEKQARWVVRRHGDAATRVIVALDTIRVNGATLHTDIGDALADYAAALGQKADQLAGGAPGAQGEGTHHKDAALPAYGAQVDSALHAVPLPQSGFRLPAGRMIPLAVAASEHAALSSRGECYLRGMPAQQALQLARNALVGVRELTVSEVQRRVHGRYPQAQPLPGHPQLDELMRSLELDYQWQAASSDKPGYYRLAEAGLGTTHWSTSTAYSASTVFTAPGAHSDQLALVEKQVQQSLATGRFLAISIRPSQLQQARQALVARYDLHALDLDVLLFTALKQHLDAMAKPPRWSVVLQADAEPPGSRNRNRLERLIREVLPAVEATIAASDKPVLLYHPGLLARYGLVNTWLAELRRRFAAEHKPLLLLVGSDAGHTQAVIDDTPVPGGAGNPEHLRLPGAWLSTNAVN